MSEIIVGTVAQFSIGAALGAAALGTDQSWVKFLASIGAVILTFLAGAELDPNVMRREWKQATIVGLVAFTAPFLGCAAVARYVIGWSTEASWLTGIAHPATAGGSGRARSFIARQAAPLCRVFWEVLTSREILPSDTHTWLTVAVLAVAVIV